MEFKITLEVNGYEGVLTYQSQGPSRDMEYDRLLCGAKLQHGTLRVVTRTNMYVERDSGEVVETAEGQAGHYRLRI